MRLFYNIGNYTKFIFSVFGRVERFKLNLKNFFTEVNKLGLNSLGIVSIISIFMGMVITLQTSAQIENPLIPAWTIGFTTRQSLILEFCPTIISLILAGKVGSNIASELGTMRVTEQIDALEIMGVNSKSFLVLPKILAAVFINPFLVVYAMVLGILGGAFVGQAAKVVSMSDYVYGLRIDFDPYTVTYSLVKTAIFAFIITSVPAYHGYYTKGGSVQVGVSSTKGVVYSSILILIANLLVTQIMLL